MEVGSGEVRGGQSKEPFRVSIREVKTVVERALLHAGLDAGVIPSAVHAVIAVEVDRGQGLSLLAQHLKHIASGGPMQLREIETGRTDRTLDCRGHSILTVGSVASDLIRIDVATSGQGTLRLIDIRGPGIASVMRSLFPQYGIQGTVSNQEGTWVIQGSWNASGQQPWTSSAASLLNMVGPTPGCLSRLEHLLKSDRSTPTPGRRLSSRLNVDETLWHQLRRYGNQILAPSSHASLAETGF